MNKRSDIFDNSTEQQRSERELSVYVREQRLDCCCWEYCSLRGEREIEQFSKQMSEDLSTRVLFSTGTRWDSAE